MKYIFYIMTLLPSTIMTLADIDQKLTTYGMIAVYPQPELVPLWNSLTPQERIFAYYLYRASLSGHRIIAQQQHRYGDAITKLIENIVDRAQDIQAICFENADTFKADCKIYLAYLLTNQGHYFKREHDKNKKTPASLKLNSITPDSLKKAIAALGIEIEPEELDTLLPHIFDINLEPTTTVPDSIEQSAVNLYSPDFTESDYQKMNAGVRSKQNIYCFNEDAGPAAFTYSTEGLLSRELTVSHYWINKAYEHAQQYPKEFDQHLVTSLKYLRDYLVNGDESLFKLHSVEWLKSKSRIDYNFGFLESYKDPKSTRGLFQAEATIKTVDLKALETLLPAIEKALPVPETFKRDLSDSSACLPNASINIQIFGTGDLGPLCIVGAYCLPNDEEIRATHGSKQIMYPTGKTVSDMIKPGLARKIGYPKKQAEWLEKNDPEKQFLREIWNVQCILHETIGHASGKLSTHTFKEGDNLTIGNQTYAVGDTLEVTNANIKELLAGYEQTIEELRAEIIALYVSVHHAQALIDAGIFKGVPQGITHDELVDWLILGMAKAGIGRLNEQPNGALEVSGDHARANYTIMNYLIDGGGLEMVEQSIDIDGTTHTVLGLDVRVVPKALKSIKDLLIEVQRIKSTGDGQGAQNLLTTYGITIRDPKHVTIVKANRKALTGDIRASVTLYPLLAPIKNAEGIITDIQATWPEDIFEMFKEYDRLQYSTQ